MGRPRKNTQDTQNQSPSEEAKAEPKAEEYPEEVTFVWNRASKDQVVVMESAQVMFTDSGPITDPRKPAKRIKVKNGLYTTTDCDEIAFLTSHKNFNSKCHDGFSIVKQISPKDELDAVIKRHNFSKKQLAEIANGE